MSLPCQLRQDVGRQPAVDLAPLGERALVERGDDAVGPPRAERSMRDTRYCTTPGPACNCRSASCFRMIEPSSSSSGGATATAGAARSREARSGKAMRQWAGGSSETSSRWPRRSRIRL